MINSATRYPHICGNSKQAVVQLAPALETAAQMLAQQAEPIFSGNANEHHYYMLASTLRMERERYGKNTHDHVLLAFAINIALDAHDATPENHTFHSVYGDLVRSSFPILATQAPHRAIAIIGQRLKDTEPSIPTRQLVLDAFGDNILHLMRAESLHSHNEQVRGVPARAVAMLEHLAATPHMVPQAQRAHLLAELDKAENPLFNVPQDIMAEAQLVMAKWHDQPHEAVIQQRLIGAWLYTAQMLANPKDRLGIKDKPADTAASDHAKLQRMAIGALRAGDNSPTVMAFLQQHDLLPKTAPATTVKPPELVGPVAHMDVVGPPRPALRPNAVPARTWPVATTALKPVFA
jgi:hypothetical protein